VDTAPKARVCIPGGTWKFSSFEFPARNRESRRHEAAGRRNYPEAVPEKKEAERDRWIESNTRFSGKCREAPQEYGGWSRQSDVGVWSTRGVDGVSRQRSATGSAAASQRGVRSVPCSRAFGRVILYALFDSSFASLFRRRKISVVIFFNCLCPSSEKAFLPS
jgi:hypothetical protein